VHTSDNLIKLRENASSEGPAVNQAQRQSLDQPD